LHTLIVDSVIEQMKLPRNQFYMKSSELFESEVYLEEVSDVMCIAQAGKTVFDTFDIC